MTATTIKKPTMPTININGSDRDTLMTAYTDLSRMGQEMIDAMRANRPHPRDYQLEPSRYEKARAEYEANMDKVREASRYLLDVAVGIYDQK